MLRFGFVLLINALPLLGMEAMSTRRETTTQVFDCGRSPRRLSELAAQGGTVFGPDSRRCTGVNAGAASAKRHPQLRGRSGPCTGAGAPLQRCARRSLQQNSAVAAPPDPSLLSLPTARWQKWRLKPLACLEQLPRHQRQSLLESPARRCEFGGEHRPGGPDPATVSCEL